MYSIFVFCMLLFLSVCDIRSRMIPKGVIIAGCVGALIKVILQVLGEGPLAEQLGFLIYALSGALPGTVLVMLSFFSDKIGRGDGAVLLFAGIGKTCMHSMILICIACILLAVPGLLLMIAGRIRRNTHIPFIPFVTASFVILEVLSMKNMGGVCL